MTRAEIARRAAAMAKSPSKASQFELERLADVLIGRRGDCLTRHQMEHRRRREIPWDPNFFPA